MIGHAQARVRVYLCGCGPIIEEAIDLAELATRISAVPGVEAVLRHSTPCSDEGREWMARDLGAHPGSLVVVAGCSPKKHEATFMAVLRAAGMNPFSLAIAPVRENSTWVTPDRSDALDKAEDIVRAAISRVMEQSPLVEREIECRTDALVIGAGVAGLTASRTLASADRKVVLVERSPALGGRAALLGDVFPGMECASCLMDPLIDEVLHHPLVEVMTLSEVEEVLGEMGNFTVRIRRRARHVNLDGCIGCRSCQAVCPVDVPNEFDLGMSSRKAVHLPYEGALPGASLVDESACLHFEDGSCSACVEACPFGNVDLDARDETVLRDVGAIVVATGVDSEPVEAADDRACLLPAMAVERMLSSAGPTGGKICLPGREPPGSVAMLHCTDGSARGPVPKCSAVCCMVFAKFAHEISERLPGCEIVMVLRDRCIGGSGWASFIRDADMRPGVRIVRLGSGDSIDGISFRDGRTVVACTTGGRKSEFPVDMAIVSPPLGGAEGAEALAIALGLKTDESGFILTERAALRPFGTAIRGIWAAGSAVSPVEAGEAAFQGAAAAGAALAALVPGRRLTVEPAVARVDGSLCCGCRTCEVTCPFGAARIDPASGESSVNELLCRGCGSCAAACPSGAIAALNFTDAQLHSEILQHLREASPGTVK